MHLHPHRTLISTSTLTLLALVKRRELGRALAPRHRSIPLALLIASGCVGVDDAADLSGEALAVAVAASEGDTTLACDWSPYPGYAISSVTFEIDPDMDAAPASEDMDEKCRVWEPYATRHGLAGVQLRITVNDRTALCTVDDASHDRPEAQALVLMSTQGFQSRFGTTVSPQTGSWTTYPVSACGWVAQPLPSIASTLDTTFGIGDFYSAPTGGPAARRVAFTAPHGGGIETGTWEQVQHLHSLHAASAHFWLVRSVGNGARRWHVNSDDLSFKSFRGLHELHEGFSPANGEQVRDQLVCNGSRQFEPGAGFQPVSYLNSTGAPVKARVVGVAYTKNTTAANIQLKATLGAI